MAADVSTLVRLMNGAADANESGKSTAPITRDFLGGCCSTLETKELDLDLQVPCGWEKRLDLKSGKVYLQRCSNSTNNSSSSTTSDSNNRKTKLQLENLNFPPTPKHTTSLSLFETPAFLDLKLADSPSSYESSSVCTLDKVKYALERAHKESSVKKRSTTSSMSQCSSSPLSNSSSSIKVDGDFLDHEEMRSSSWGGGYGGGSFAAGCPKCLLYVLISASNPKCPRCNSSVPLPVVAKKPRIDLNISM